MGDLGKKLFLDLAYELTQNTVQSSSSQCSSLMDNGYDDCLMQEIPLALSGEFGCSVPYLPGNETMCQPPLSKDMAKVRERNN